MVVRDEEGGPMVIANEPFLRDGTPMPTRYWLVDPQLRVRVGRLEAAGGVREAAAQVDLAALADAHRRYAAERDALIPVDWKGPRPRGGGRDAPGRQVSACPRGVVVGRRGGPRRSLGGATTGAVAGGVRATLLCDTPMP